MKRMPTRKSAIEKRNTIIEKGFALICYKGYHNITTNDIAKAAGVSVGIIYQYFDDKKDILIEGVKNHINSVLYPTTNILEEKILTEKNAKNIISNAIDIFIKTHTMSKKAHEELISLSHQDKEIEKLFKKAELEISDKIVDFFERSNLNLKNAEEKAHIIVGLIENLSHEIVYHKHKKMNYDVMKNEVINVIMNIIKYA